MGTKFVILLAVYLTYIRISNGVRLQNPCPPNKPEVGCKPVNLCSLSSCQQYPNAQCYEDHCGQCKARWFNGNTEVTDICTPDKTNCVNNEKRSKCLTNECDGKTCAIPNAECVFDTCGGCHARWYNGSHEITHLCENFPSWQCKNNKMRVFCFNDPCASNTSFCPGVPAAKCRSDRCQLCSARWYVGSLEVTDKCSNPNSCAVNLCQNGGICISLPNTYQCLCREGYSGSNCEHYDKCLNNPCQNGGTCMNSPHSYQCQCQTGYTGLNCEILPKPAYERCRYGRLVQLGKCSSQGACPSGFYCSGGPLEPGLCCLTHTQNLCEGALPYAVNEDASACVGPNGILCPDKYTCVSSQNPNTPVSVCCPKKEVPANNQDICVNGERRVSCKKDPCKNAVCPMQNAECVSDYCGGCYDRWYIGNSETTPFCEHKATGFCENGKTYQTCVVDPCVTPMCYGVPGAICRTDACGGCFARWFVNSLEVTENCNNTNRCDPNQCLNGGICVSEKTTYRCICAEGYTGQNCQTRDYCSNNPCLNGATCANIATTYECTCSAGYMDPYCGTQDYCYNNPCLNGGSCTNEANTYKCSCPPGYAGSECQTQTTVPEYLKCKYGRLVKDNATVTCSPQMLNSCPPGFFCSGGPAGETGPCCLDERQNLCGIDQPLRNNGDVEACWGGQQNYKQCLPGHVCKYSLDPERRVSACCPEKKQDYPPSTCINNETRVQCTRDPCDGVSCSFVPNAQCIPDYCGGCYDRWFDGSQEVTAQCKSRVPGTCLNRLKHFYCTENPCGAAVCPGVPAAVCRTDVCGGCFARWYAGRLEVSDKCKNHNRCLPNACKNGGTCISLQTTFMCHCADGFSGSTCETNYRCQPNTCLNGGSCVNLAKSYKCNCSPGYTGQHCETSLLPKEHEKCEFGKPIVNGQPLTCMPGIINSCPVGFYCKGGAGVMTSQCCLKAESNICTGGTPYHVNGEAVSCGGSSATVCPADHTCKSNTDPQYPVSVCCRNPPPVQYPSTCANGKIKTECPTDLCQNASCIFPYAECVSDTCGGCYDRWFVSKFEVTPICKGQSPGTCSNGLTFVKCTPGLCSNPASCPGVPNAVCRVDHCGTKCIERYFLGSQEVTDNCKTATGAADMSVATTPTPAVDKYTPGTTTTVVDKTITTPGPTSNPLYPNPDRCQPNPCLNGGVCVSLPTTYKCTCKGNYVGTNCEVQQCGGIQCQNGGSCVNQATGECTCPPGFYGETCQYTDACATNPCINGGTCVNTANSYTCTCMPEYEGPTCNVHVPTPAYKKCLFGQLSNGSSEVMCDPMAVDRCPKKFFCSISVNYDKGKCCLEPEDNLCGTDIPFRVNGHAKSCGASHAFKCPAGYICKSSNDATRPVSVCCPTKPPVKTKPGRLDCRYGTYYPDIITSPSCKDTTFNCPDGFRCRGASNTNHGNCCYRKNPCVRNRPLSQSGNAYHCMGTGSRACPKNYECVGTADHHSVCCPLTTRQKCPRRRPDNKCQVNLCKVTYCPSVPDARCVMNVCGKCEARWYNGGNDVTNDCRKQPGCPPDKPKAPCLVNPCDTATCAKHPTAKCSTEYCGTPCKAKFFVDLKEVQC